MGNISIIWARIIIVGVYKIWKNPSGPELEKTMYKTKPTNTGGKPIKEFVNIIRNFFPVKFFTLQYAAIGNPKKQDIIKAEIETLRESIKISDSSVSKVNISWKEFINISIKSLKILLIKYFHIKSESWFSFLLQ